MFPYRINIYLKLNTYKKQEKTELESIFKDL